ncbi:hypothetical protein BV20DRAFT_1112882 [Pilatotrama ljubarskyi]|nr:hypothetical protein BV20DRAFT_1112882 [Pilatotrama ljubarskyi]
MSTSTTTKTPPAVMTSEVPLVAGDVLRAIDTPAVEPPTASPPPAAVALNASTARANGNRSGSPNGSVKSAKGHRRTSSAASDIAKAAGIDLDAVSMAEARKVMSEEHKILGFRPPHGSFAAEVQSIAAKHPEGKPGASPPDTAKLKEIAREDALRILAERKTNTGADKDALPPTAKPVNGSDKHVTPARHSPPDPSVNLNKISADAARVLMSHEHRALGFRPPPGSLAAEAQSAAARHPDGDGTHLDDDTLREIALRDAERIKADRELNLHGESGINVSTLGKEAAAAVASAEARALGHPPPKGSLAAEAQSAADRHPEGGTFKPDGNPVEMERLKEAARREGEKLREEEERAKREEGKEVVEAAKEAAAKAQENGANGAEQESSSTPTNAGTAQQQQSPPKADKAIETEPLTDAPPSVARKLTTPPLSRSETGESVEIVGDVLA